MLRVQAVTQELERRVVDAQYAVGERLPTEPELAHEFGVSRTTIRGAISAMQARGLVSREQGRGTFVRDRGRVSVNMLLETNLSVTQVIRGSGLLPGTTGLSVTRELAPAEAVAALQVPDGSRCIVVRRTRTASGVPAADSIDYLLEVPSLPVDAAAYSDSIYEQLERTHGSPVSTGTAHIEAKAAAGVSAERLGLAEGAPVLLLSQVHELGNGRPVMYSVISLRSDVINLYVHRGQRQDGSLHTSEHRSAP